MPPRRIAAAAPRRIAARRALEVVKNIAKDVRNYVNPALPTLKRKKNNDVVITAVVKPTARVPKSPSAARRNEAKLIAIVNANPPKKASKSKKAATSLNDVVEVLDDDKEKRKREEEANREEDEFWKKTLWASNRNPANKRHKPLPPAPKRKAPRKALPPIPTKRRSRNSAGVEAPKVPERETTVISVSQPVKVPAGVLRRRAKVISVQPIGKGEQVAPMTRKRELPSVRNRSASPGRRSTGMPPLPPFLAEKFNEIIAGRASLPAEPPGMPVAHPVDSNSESSSSDDGPAEPDDLSRVSVRDTPHRDWNGDPLYD